MATKTIALGHPVGQGALASGPDMMLLPLGATDSGVYPQTVAGITAGASPNNSGGRTTADQLASTDLDEFNYSVLRAPGGGAQRIRVDRPAGTFNVKLLTLLEVGEYQSGVVRIIDADGTTVLHSRGAGASGAGGGPHNDSGTAPVLITSANAAVSVVDDAALLAAAAADPGVSITTTGGFFFVELEGVGGFPARLSSIRYNDGQIGGGGPTTLGGDLSEVAVAGRATFSGAIVTWS